MELIDDKLFDSQGNEIFIGSLTLEQEQELERIVNKKYLRSRAPSNSVSPNRQVQLWEIADLPYTDNEKNKIVPDWIIEIGGKRLTVLLENNFNFNSTAEELGITNNALRTWWYRLLKKCSKG